MKKVIYLARGLSVKAEEIHLLNRKLIEICGPGKVLASKTLFD